MVIISALFDGGSCCDAITCPMMQRVSLSLPLFLLGVIFTTSQRMAARFMTSIPSAGGSNTFQIRILREEDFEPFRGRLMPLPADCQPARRRIINSEMWLPVLPVLFHFVWIYMHTHTHTHTYIWGFSAWNIAINYLLGSVNSLNVVDLYVTWLWNRSRFECFRTGLKPCRFIPPFSPRPTPSRPIPPCRMIYFLTRSFHYLSVYAVWKRGGGGRGEEMIPIDWSLPSAKYLRSMANRYNCRACRAQANPNDSTDWKKRKIETQTKW